MDKVAQQLALIDFVFALPMTIMALTYMTGYTGRLAHGRPAPRWTRWLAVRLKADLAGPANPSGVLMTGLLIGFFDLVPIAYLASPTPSSQALAIDLAYVVVEGLFIGSVLRALFRSGGPVE